MNKTDPKQSHKTKYTCKFLRDEWLACETTYKGSASFSKGSALCNNKLKEYLYSCGERDERKRFVCSILAAH